MTHAVDLHPSFLQQVVGEPAADELRQKESMKLRTQTTHESGRGCGIAILITRH
jgi:hypothetical protein